MNITREQIDELNAVVKIALSPEDYQPKVEKALKEHAKKANIPGFRPGKVPAGLIKKMYGKSVLADEVNRLLYDTIYDYIQKEQLDILGNPMPKNDTEVNWDNPSAMEFNYRLGLAPKFDVKLSADKSFDYLTIKVDDEMVNEQVKSMRERYGKIVQAEVSQEDDMLMGEFEQLDSDGNAVEGGIKKSSTVFISRIEDEATKKSLLGLKKGDTINLSPRKVWSDNAVLGRMLGIDEAIAKDLNASFKFTVSDISRVEPADLNQEFFDKIYGEGKVTSEEQMREKIVEEIKAYYNNESERKFFNDAVEYLLNEININLPDEFLKTWMLSVSEKPITPEQLEADYPSYTKGLKWQLIENKIVKDHDLQATSEDLLDFTKQYLRERFMSYGHFNVTDEELNQTARKVLQNQEEARKLYDQIIVKKIQELFKKTFKLVEKELPQKEFFDVIYKQEHTH
jgi:trigger factor